MSGEDGATTITTDNGTLQMNAEVSPSDASNKSVTWSVTETDGSATDKATISSTGLLTAVKNGTVKVTATAQDGSGVTGSIEITISNQVAEVVDASVYDTLVGSLPKNNDDDTYTTPSWAAYQEAIDECDLTLTEADGQAALDAEVIKIQAALELLELTAEVDTSAYDAIVTEVGALVEADYTGDSWALYEAAIADCNLTLEAKDGQAALDAEVIAIQAALELLTEVIYSNYELTITGPETAEPEDVLLFNVTAKGDNTGNTNYAAVIYNYEVTGGEGTLEYLDGETWKALPLAGHFGPSGGFELTPDWDVTTQLRFTPAAEGSYSVEVTLDVVDGAELAKATHNIEVAEVVDTTAPELGEVTLTTDEDDNLVLTVVASDNAGLASLEVDHSLEDILPEFTVGTEDVTDEETGASSTFDEATGTWTLNFGPQVSKEIRENAEKITFYFVITDVNGNEFGSMDPTTPENTREFDVPVEKIAPELENVTLTTDEDDNLVLTVVASDNAGLASLEVDHSLEDILPEFTVGTEDVTDEETGASSTFDEATGTWTLNFGPQVSKEIRENAEKITFYFVITDVNGNEFGSMDPTTPENTREFDVPVEKIAPELGNVTLTTDEDDNLVLTVVASDNAGLASLEVDHSLEDILPEFTVGTEDVTDEETGASSTFDEATGTWTLNFGPQVSKEIRENAEKITFYFVITDVNGNEFGSMDPTTPENTREFDVPVEKIAPELENVTLTTDEDDNLVLTVVASDNAGLASLEVDHSLEDILPEFTVGTEDVTDEETGASSTFDEATGTWTLNFGPQVSKEIRENAEKITFYFVITDVNGNEFGSMDPTTPENTREFDVPVEKIAPELGEVTLTTDEDDNLVLTVVASDNAGLASLEVDHSLEDILPEFTVGTEDVTDEETGASSTFDEATGTWTLNFGPQVSKEIRENAEKITFYFVITDVNGNEFGSMDPTTPENTREFDVPVEKIAPELEM